MTNPGSPSSWRDPILVHFTPEIATVARLTIVSDPDRLLTEETILDRIRARGFDLIPFEDHVAFRYAYETRYRRAWDQGEQTNLVVILHTLHADIAKLPFDLLEWAQRERRLLRFSRAELFPDLSPAVLDELDSSVFDALHRALAINEPGGLGDNATKDFLLRHVFEIAPEQIRTAGISCGCSCGATIAGNDFLRRSTPGLSHKWIRPSDSPAGPWRGSYHTGRSSSRSFRSGGHSS